MTGTLFIFSSPDKQPFERSALCSPAGPALHSELPPAPVLSLPMFGSKFTSGVGGE
jgi:hypothetical protein